VIAYHRKISEKCLLCNIWYLLDKIKLRGETNYIKAGIGAVEGTLSIIGSFMRFCHLEKLHQMFEREN